jgi:hypothetical protein
MCTEASSDNAGHVNAAASAFGKDGRARATADGESAWLSDSQWRDAEQQHYQELAEEGDELLVEPLTPAQAKRQQRLGRRRWRVPEKRPPRQRPRVRARHYRRARSALRSRARGHRARRSRSRRSRPAARGRGDPEPGAKLPGRAVQTSGPCGDKRPDASSATCSAAVRMPVVGFVVAPRRDA